jgi:hypothetical protein
MLLLGFTVYNTLYVVSTIEKRREHLIEHKHTERKEF